MKLLRVFLIGVISVNFIGCDQSQTEGSRGEDVSQNFLSQYNGNYREQTGDSRSVGESMKISRNGDIEVHKIRQVGTKEDPTTPNGTVCSYILTGQIRYVLELFEVQRERINADNEKTYLVPQTHELTFSVKDIVLTNDLEPNTTENVGCQNYATRLKANLPNYTYGMELFDSGTIRLHTAGGGDYQGGERTESTLDEIFIRQ